MSDQQQQIYGLKVKELQAELRKRDIIPRGKRDELREQLLAAIAAETSTNTSQSPVPSSSTADVATAPTADRSAMKASSTSSQTDKLDKVVLSKLVDTVRRFNSFNDHCSSSTVTLRSNPGRRRVSPTIQIPRNVPVLKKQNRPRSHIFNGAKTFKQLLDRSTVIVDRSLFLSELFNNDTQAIMVCLPQGVGKTMLLSMAHAFFTHQPDRFGSAKYAMFSQEFEGNRQFKIMANEQFVQDHFGVYPTLYISLKGVSGDCKQMEHQIGAKIKRKFCQHEELLLTTHLLTAKEKKCIEHFAENVPTKAEWTEAVEILTGALSKCHNKDAFILIDDYDAPILNERSSFSASANWRDANSLVRDFIDALEQAPDVDQQSRLASRLFCAVGRSHSLPNRHNPSHLLHIRHPAPKGNGKYWNLHVCCRKVSSFDDSLCGVWHLWGPLMTRCKSI